MSSEDKVFYFVVVFVITIAFLVCGGNIFHTRYQIGKAVENGADPIEASIAITGLSSVEGMAYIVKKGEEK